MTKVKCYCNNGVYDLFGTEFECGTCKGTGQREIVENYFETEFVLITFDKVNIIEKKECSFRLVDNKNCFTLEPEKFNLFLEKYKAWLNSKSVYVDENGIKIVEEKND
jgi:hypothetical protein